MIGNKRLSIILPSYNDSRIERAIQSIRHFDDLKTVRIVVIDGDANAQMGAAMLPFYHRMKTQGLLPNLTWVILNNGMCMSTDGQGSPALDSLFYLVADRIYKTLPPTSEEIGQRINARENEGLFPKETLNFVVKRFRRLVDAQETTLSLKHKFQGESPLPAPKLRAVD